MTLSTMYEGKNNSPQTDITSAITAADQIIPVTDISVFPAAPNLATIGNDENAEVIRYNGIDGSMLTGCERGFGGTTASAWGSGAPVARYYTSYDHDTFIANIDNLNENKSDIMEKVVSGTTVTVTDAGDAPVRDLEVGINPVQDLHGYSSPWPNGGSKNLLPLTVNGLKAVNTSGTWNGNIYTINDVTFTLNLDNDENIVGILINGTNSSNDIQFYLSNNASSVYIALQEGTQYKIIAGNNDNSEINIRIGNKTNTFVCNTASSGINTFTADTQNTVRIHVSSGITATNLLFAPMIQLESETDNTFVPYSNICPISGWTGMNVQRTGESLSNFEQGGLNKGINVASTVRIRSKYYIPYQENKPVYINYNQNYSGEEIKIKIQYYDNATNYLSEYPGGNNWIVSSTTIINVPNNTKFIRLLAGLNSNTSITPDIGNNNINISYNTEIFEPYQGETYSISWQSEAGTVYGGSLDVTTGLLTVDRASVDLGTLSWDYASTNGGYFSCALPQSKTYNTPTLICSIYKYGGYNNSNAQMVNLPDKSIIKRFDNGLSANATAIRIKDSAYTDATTFTTAMDGVQAVYELATPITYQLSPTIVETLLGLNTIWADTGGILNLDYFTPAGESISDFYAFFNSKQDKLTFDTTPTAGSTNPVTSGGIKTALDAKQGTLTFDTTPTASSSNPVTSGGIYTAIHSRALHISMPSTSTLGEISNPAITTTMRVVNIVWGTPSNVTSNVSWNTNTAGKLILSGTLSGPTTAEIDLINFG